MKAQRIWTEFTITTTPPWPRCPNLNICMRCGWSTLTGPIAPTWLPRAFSSSPHSCLLHVAVLDRSFKSKQGSKRRLIVWYQWGDEANLKTWFASSIQQFFSFIPARAFILWWNTLTLQPQGSCGTTTVAMAVSAEKCPSHKTIVFVDNKIWGWNQLERRTLCNCACRIHFSTYSMFSSALPPLGLTWGGITLLQLFRALADLYDRCFDTFSKKHNLRWIWNEGRNIEWNSEIDEISKV